MLARAKSLPHCSQKSALCLITASGIWVLNKSVDLTCPGCPPVFFPLLCRRLLLVFLGGLYRSVDGGRELLELFLGSLAMYSCWVKSAICRSRHLSFL